MVCAHCYVLLQQSQKECDQERALKFVSGIPLSQHTHPFQNRFAIRRSALPERFRFLGLILEDNLKEDCIVGSLPAELMMFFDPKRYV
ncbi:unnamed protein product [Toxocara canis]|uniref:Uncharacterized protein n=1 Tax=Toxocara canis TaxID=6265 RepID=A0A183VDA8_TOXCA|nr:unnamed protein product [Toxocara canis]